MNSKYAGDDRRKSKRIRILETFSLAVVVPSKGLMRLPITDLSEQGIGFSIDTELFSEEEFLMKKGDEFELHVYLNQSFGVPLKVRVVRILTKKMERLIGAEFQSTHAKSKETIKHFVKMLNAAIEAT